LFATQIAAHDQATHTVRYAVDEIHRLAVFILQTSEEEAKRRSHVLNGGVAGHRAVIEEQTGLPICLEYLIRDPERTFEGGTTAVSLISIHKNHRKFSRPRDRLTGSNELRAKGYC